MTIRSALFLTLLLSAGAPHAQNLEPLVHEGVIEAPIAAVWDAWTTSEGLESWLAPHAEIDLRIGGKMRSNYDAGASLDDPQSIENTILAFDPLRMFSIRVSKAPANFPFAEVVMDMWTVVYLDAVDAARTRIRVVGLGFTADPQSQAMRNFFEQGNAATIRQLQQRFPADP